MTASVHNQHRCCCENHQPSISQRLFQLLEKVSAVALGIFSAYASLELFLPFFLAGMAIGLYQYFSEGPPEEDPGVGVACSQGLLEQLTQVKLPPLVSLGANLAITWCHIDHHTTIFVPVVGLSIGAWAGQSLADLGSRICPIRQEA